MNSFFKKIFDFFLFTSLYVACCAVIMVYQTYSLIIGKPVDLRVAAFIFFSTICSYNFHWALTPNSLAPSHRLQWEQHHKSIHLILSLVGLSGSMLFFFLLKEHWFYVGIAIVFTFLYSAPKISLAPFQWLKKIAIGKTIFLAAAWAYVTAALPVLIEGNVPFSKMILFFFQQFFFIYAICILFDFRDREDDKADGIRTMITYFDERGIDILFAVSVTIFVILSFLLKRMGIEWLNIVLLLIPGTLLVALYKYAKKNFSDYFYYFVLDGLMMLAGLLLWLVNRF